MIPDNDAGGPLLAEATRELEAAIHDARVAFDCIGLGELDRAHTAAVTARAAVDAAVTAVQAALAERRAGQTRELTAGKLKRAPICGRSELRCGIWTSR